jgi:anti-anti-sigma factor
MELRGFVFFGSAHELRETVKTLLAEHKLLMLIFDFGKVVGIDSSAATAMVGISRLLRDKNVQQCIVGLSPAVIQVVRESGGFDTDVVVLADIDEALEQGEEIVLVPMHPDRRQILLFSIGCPHYWEPTNPLRPFSSIW